MRGMLQRVLDPDTFLRVWAAIMLAWLVTVAVLIGAVAHFIVRYW